MAVAHSHPDDDKRVATDDEVSSPVRTSQLIHEALSACLHASLRGAVPNAVWIAFTHEAFPDVDLRAIAMVFAANNDLHLDEVTGIAEREICGVSKTYRYRHLNVCPSGSSVSIATFHLPSEPA